MERRFACTACGKCCHGLLPLTLADSLTHAGRFPLGVVLTPVRQGHKAFDLTARLGATVKLPNRRQLAVRVAPMAYIPSPWPCPELAPDGLCRIHADKPWRCRTMPLFPYIDEAAQTEMLIPRPGWACDTSSAAPVVYRDKVIVERQDFDHERKELVMQAPVLRAYADWLVATVPGLVDTLVAAAAKPVGGDLLLGFHTLLRRLDTSDRAALAQQQLAILAQFAARTEGDPTLAEHHRHYQDWSREMEKIARRATA